MAMMIAVRPTLATRSSNMVAIITSSTAVTPAGFNSSSCPTIYSLTSSSTSSSLLSSTGARTFLSSSFSSSSSLPFEKSLPLSSPLPSMHAVESAAAFRRLVNLRKSTNRFQPDKIVNDDIIVDILDSTLTSPSGFNLQPTHVMIVRCPILRKSLAKNAMLGPGNAYRTVDSSFLAVFLSDLEPTKRIARIVKLERDWGGRNASYLSTLPVVAGFLLGTNDGLLAGAFKRLAANWLSGPVDKKDANKDNATNNTTFDIPFPPDSKSILGIDTKPMPSMEDARSWGYKNASLMAQTFVLAATSHDLSTCMMEGFDARCVKQILSVPDRYAIPLMVATGYEYQDKDKESINDGKETPGGKGNSENDGGVRDNRTPRLPREVVFFGDGFGKPLDLSWGERKN